MVEISNKLHDFAEDLEDLYNVLKDIKDLADDVRHAQNTVSIDVIADDLESRAKDGLQILKGK